MSNTRSLQDLITSDRLTVFLNLGRVVYLLASQRPSLTWQPSPNHRIDSSFGECSRINIYWTADVYIDCWWWGYYIDQRSLSYHFIDAISFQSIRSHSLQCPLFDVIRTVCHTLVNTWSTLPVVYVHLQAMQRQQSPTLENDVVEWPRLGLWKQLDFSSVRNVA